MGRQLTEKELKRFGRVIAGHMQDKDRERWKRKLKGQAKPAERPRKPESAGADDPLDETLEAEDEPR